MAQQTDAKIKGVKQDEVLTYVNHDSLLAHFSEGLGSADSTPVKLDGASDTVDTASKNHGSLVLKGDIMRRSIVRGVKVVGIGREFSSEGVNLLDPGVDTKAVTVGANLVLGGLDGHGDLSVRETQLLGLENLVLLQSLEAAGSLHLAGAVNQVLELVQEPFVNLGQVMDLVDGVVLVEHGLANGEPSAVSRVLELKVEIVKLVTLETDKARVNLTNSLLERFFKGTTDSHNFTDRLHGTANVALDVLELGKIPAGDLGHNVVQRRLKVGCSGLGNGVRQLGKRVTETNLGSCVSKRVASSLGSESRRSRKTGIDLNDTVVEAVRLQGVLDVAFTNDAKMADNLDGGGAKHVVFLIAQSLTGGNDNGVTSMDTERIKVFHVAYCDAVVVGIADDFVFDFLPAFKRLFNQDLRRQGQGASCHVAELLLVVGKTGTETTKGIGGTNNNGVSDLFGSIKRLVNGTDSDGFGNGNLDLVKSLGEQITILRQLERANTCTEDLDAVLFKKTHSLHLNTEIQGGLAAKRQEDAIGLFSLNDIRDVFGSDGQVVDLVGKRVVGLNGSNVWVDKDRGDARFFESLECLRPYAEIKLAV